MLKIDFAPNQQEKPAGAIVWCETLDEATNAVVARFPDVLRTEKWQTDNLIKTWIGAWLEFRGRCGSLHAKVFNESVDPPGPDEKWVYAKGPSGRMMMRMEPETP